MIERRKKMDSFDHIYIHTYTHTCIHRLISIGIDHLCHRFAERIWGPNVKEPPELYNQWQGWRWSQDPNPCLQRHRALFQLQHDIIYTTNFPQPLGLNWPAPGSLGSTCFLETWVGVPLPRWLPRKLCITSFDSTGPYLEYGVFTWPLSYCNVRSLSGTHCFLF